MSCAPRPLASPTFKQQQGRLRGDQSLLFDLLQDAQRQIDGAYLQTAQNTLELAKSAKMLVESRAPQERLEFLKKLLSNAVLDGRIIKFELKKPFLVLSEVREVPENSVWRAVEESNL
ncbi:MAG: hypothetical protein IT381_20530 [Deltaproteobacteria bacterium]|nr:hypothetical protein [Deltaproteobacteria bacterium]